MLIKKLCCFVCFLLLSFIAAVCLKNAFGKKTLMTKDESIAKNVILCHVHILHNPRSSFYLYLLRSSFNLLFVILVYPQIRNL